MNHLKSWAAVSVLGLTLHSTSALATLTLVSIDGASNTDISTTTPVIYGGFAGTCSPSSNTSTCNSCTGADGVNTLFPCNKRNILPNTRLTISMTTTEASTVETTFTLNGNAFISSVNPVSDGTNLIVQIPWGDLCAASSSGGGASCTVGFSAPLVVKHGADSLTFSVRTRVAPTVPSEWFYTDCESTSVAASMGMCHFKVFPGDEKLYTIDLYWADGYPTTPVAGIEYRNVTFFYEQQQSGETDGMTVARITNASPSATFPVSQSANPPVSDNRITGLENDARYCAIMANEDVTGVISFFTPSTANPADLCADPSLVVGLLDDKKCFIATAAFGSDMAPEVQSFREFRNEFLLTNSAGRAFVKFYYKHSPFYANLISENSVLKSIVRMALWPALYVARASVHYGLATTLFVLSGAVALVSAFVLQRRRRFQVRGES